MDLNDPITDPYGAAQPNEAPRRARRGDSRRRVGAVVGGLLLVGAVTAAAVLSTSGGHSRSPGRPSPTVPAPSAVAITSVNVFMVDDRAPDNSSETHLAFDGDVSTFWPTDQYHTARFGNLYPGIGLEIHLSQAEQGRSLVVTSPNSGWSAETFVSASQVPSGQPVAVWGTPTDSKSAIAAGTTVFKLGPRKARWVLLWITNLGAPVPGGFYEGRIAELAIR